MAVEVVGTATPMEVAAMATEEMGAVASVVAAAVATVVPLVGVLAALETAAASIMAAWATV